MRRMYKHINDFPVAQRRRAPRHNERGQRVGDRVILTRRHEYPYDSGCTPGTTLNASIIDQRAHHPATGPFPRR